MDHQDWKPVILKKPRSQLPKPKKNGKVQPRRPDSDGVNKRKLEQDETYRPPSITPTIARQIQTTRVEKTWSQKELAQRANLDLSVVKEYEQGRGLYNRPNLDKIGRALGIIIKK